MSSIEEISHFARTKGKDHQKQKTLLQVALLTYNEHSIQIAQHQLHSNINDLFDLQFYLEFAW